MKNVPDIFSASYGRIKVITGENGARFPYGSTIYIDDDVKAVIDTGAGNASLEALKSSFRIDAVYNSHYHFDHINGNYLFEDSEIFINECEASCFRDVRVIGSLIGIKEVYGPEFIDVWIDRITNPSTPPSPYSPLNSHKWFLSSRRISGDYKWGDIIDFGRTYMHVIGAPGHSAGFSCMYFPQEGVLYAADIDLTDFGPWYGGTDGDIDLFIDSCGKIAAMDTRYVITGHEKGILTADAFRAGLEKFLSVIDERDARLLNAVGKRPATIDDIAGQGHIYGRKYHKDEYVFMWEKIMVRKHIERLVKKGAAVMNSDTVYIV